MLKYRVRPNNLYSRNRAKTNSSISLGAPLLSLDKPSSSSSLSSASQSSTSSQETIHIRDRSSSLSSLSSVDSSDSSEWVCFSSLDIFG
ncbi:unnamed protein product [Gongylonema pulchrum]|uniref:Uncharacterized protein n=1 Tax=Gongylonema pulchrum TaxID=637853 RepID=A0A183DHD8_9BILA|nr:unnamed protein product [Gongylonema pulchrum]